jgi:HAD superfamily hydrolase (TIGR01509 family)
MKSRIPLVALIGLPNAGKSTLLNRISASNKAITAREEHTTRDLNYGMSDWDGMEIKFVDSGGLVPDPDDKIQKEIQVKTGMAIAMADILVWVIDRRQDPETINDKLIKKIWNAKKPLMIVINKVDDPNHERDLVEYAKLGGFGFANISSFNSYGINSFLDQIVTKCLELGFERNLLDLPEIKTKEKKKTKVPKQVHKNSEGSFYIIRNSDRTGGGLYEAVNNSDETVKVNPIKNVVVDIFDVCLITLGGEYIVNEPVLEALEALNNDGVKIYYLSNSDNSLIKDLQKEEWFDIFDGGVCSEEAGSPKPNLKIFSYLIKKYEIDPDKTLFVDDTKENVEAARDALMWGFWYNSLTLDLLTEVELIEYGRVDRIPKIPKILLLGRPNVGKSTLFNALFARDIQIVTDIAGTTLSVNDLEIEHEGQKYIILDSTGIRKSGQRTSGAETFATQRTIQAAYEADVILFVLDVSVPLTHQDQVIAGIVKESRKGVLVVANKADLIASEDRRRFTRDLNHKFAFLKTSKMVWFSAKNAYEKRTMEGKVTDSSLKYDNVEDIWTEIKTALEQRKLEIQPEDLRKLFNYIIKQKPPLKLKNKKKAIIYDLLYTKSSPPTFELLIKDKDTIHWSYVRFLENIIIQQFGFSATGITLKIKEVERKKVINK